ncbi:MAG: hypothetical protein GEV03_20445 [Streptosporangiales bacterium]|nr:hypothetical protein [Streptosporangiales bacterium]
MGRKRTPLGGRRAALLELRELLLAGEPIPTDGWVSSMEILPAVRTYLRVGAAFRRKGLPAALELMPPRPPASRPARATPGRAGTLCARSAASRVLGLARTLSGRHLCLHESLALCAALRRLGFPTQVVIGYPVIEPADGSEELHAWPALGDIPVTGPTDSSPVSYMELFRYPADGRPAEGVPSPGGVVSCR